MTRFCFSDTTGPFPWLNNSQNIEDQILEIMGPTALSIEQVKKWAAVFKVLTIEEFIDGLTDFVTERFVTKRDGQPEESFQKSLQILNNHIRANPSPATLVGLSISMLSMDMKTQFSMTKTSVCRLVSANQLDRLTQLISESHFDVNDALTDPLDKLDHSNNATYLIYWLQYCKTVEMLDLLVHLGLDCTGFLGTLRKVSLVVFQAIYERYNGSLVEWYNMIYRFTDQVHKDKIDYYNAQVYGYAQHLNCTDLIKDVLVEIAQFAYTPLIQLSQVNVEPASQQIASLL